MLEKIELLSAEIAATPIQTAEELETFRIRFLGTKNILKDLFVELKQAPESERKELGLKINALKTEAQTKFDLVQASLTENNSNDDDSTDFTLPAPVDLYGGRHPLSTMRERIVDIFAHIGFAVADGPEIEDDFHNFTALNFPPDHPAREMQDTFFISKNPDWLLRTHTSTVQVRVMQSQKPPIRYIMPGRVFRNEAISARAHCQFHQVEGIYIDKKVSMADLKQTLYYFARELFGPSTQIRFRPSFFPFTEPSAEVDISCFVCGGEGCNICKHSGWVEIGGCGMIDPNVLSACGIDPNEYSGYAFGMGIERITMLKHRITDIRPFFENDVRFLSQFSRL